MATANIESNNIKVFPSSSRGKSDNKLINPESFLTTEFNLTTLVRRLNKSSKNGEEKGFVIKSSASSLDFSLCGYWFEIICPKDFTNVGDYLASKFDTRPSSIYAIITLKDVDSGYGDSAKLEVLSAENSDNSVLDSSDGKFLGVTFADKDEGLASNQYSLLLYVLNEEDKYIVPTSSLTSISSNYILDYNSKLPISEHLTLQDLDVNNCLKFTVEGNALFLLDNNENNYYIDVNTANFTIKNGDSTLETISSSSKTLDYDDVIVNSDLNVKGNLKVVDNELSAYLNNSSKKISVYGGPSNSLLEQIKWDNSRFVKDISIPYINNSTFTNNGTIINNSLIQLSTDIAAKTSGIVLNRDKFNLIRDSSPNSSAGDSALINVPSSNINCHTLTATEIKNVSTAQFGTVTAGSITATEEISAPEITASGTNGTITAKTFNATSDARLKENLSMFKYEKSILDLPTYEYNFKGQEQRTIGVLAQDLLQLYPNLVHLDKDGFYSIEENKIIYLLKEEVRKLKEEITKLKEEVENIKRK